MPTVVSVTIAPEDHVLLGHANPLFGLPSSWSIALVLWVDGRDLVIEERPSPKHFFRSLISLDEVLAVGPPAALQEFRSEQQRRFEIHEQDLIKARRAQRQAEARAFGRWEHLREIRRLP